MEHVAIMKKSWGLTEKIVSGEKTIESRWYYSKRAPWNRIKTNDAVYFKNSGEPVTIKALVEKVLQFKDLKPTQIKEILEEYGYKDGIVETDIQKFFELFKNKKFCILIFLKDVERVKPFNIDRKRFGSMAAWLICESVERLRIQ